MLETSHSKESFPENKKLISFNNEHKFKCSIVVSESNFLEVNITWKSDKYNNKKRRAQETNEEEIVNRTQKKRVYAKPLPNK